jgi:hypothetical protein
MALNIDALVLTANNYLNGLPTFGLAATADVGLAADRYIQLPVILSALAHSHTDHVNPVGGAHAGVVIAAGTSYTAATKGIIFRAPPAAGENLGVTQRGNYPGIKVWAPDHVHHFLALNPAKDAPSLQNDPIGRQIRILNQACRLFLPMQNWVGEECRWVADATQAQLNMVNTASATEVINRIIDGSAGSLVTAAALNRRSANHTTMGDVCGGLVLKVLKTMGLWQDSWSAQEKRDMTTIIYDAVHALDIRTILAVIAENQFAGEFMIGLGFPKIASIDVAHSLRVTAPVAGTHKPMTTMEAAKVVASSKLLLIAPNAHELGNLRNACAEIRDKGLRAHAGAPYLFAITNQHAAAIGIEPWAHADLGFNQNDASYTSIMNDISVAIAKISPTSTLAQSPFIAQEAASPRDPAWAAMCTAYRTAVAAGVDLTQTQQVIEQIGAQVGAWGEWLGQYDPTTPAGYARHQKIREVYAAYSKYSVSGVVPIPLITRQTMPAQDWIRLATLAGAVMAP